LETDFGKRKPGWGKPAPELLWRKGEKGNRPSRDG